MSAIVVNGIKYIRINNTTRLKLRSTDDWVYYTLQDILLNINDEQRIIKANELTALLVKEKTNTTVEYTNALDDISYIRNIYGFISSINETSFHFVEKTFDEKEEYMEYNVWYNMLKTLLERLVNIMVDICTYKP
jgi:hypothetical protein